ncbi:molybdopterin cofactor-binding domain-containing protein [Nostoc sp. 'Peltigera malacea cyanobiont' DB3992]|uniref:molybdopterin cofactor-binding domain-containing protein n=1 Tax=Nostoc sp. 'Peltigera malacea cyanobiont' DB3992 TaxID=1206980 RepID=UPI00117FED2A|nr:molybdopterin cofactor-binding domain-containing protein [Nostoc sp. 'Peltigera malacea cyanobiont' DB3992]
MLHTASVWTFTDCNTRFLLKFVCSAIASLGTIAVWSGDFLTLYEPTTWVYGIRNAVAEWLPMPREKIRVIQQFVGGSFGYKDPA